MYPNKQTDLKHRTTRRVQRNASQRPKIQDKVADAKHQDELKKIIAAEKEALKVTKLHLASLNAELESGMSSDHRQKNPFRPAPAETNSSGKVPTKPTPPKNGHKRGDEQNIDRKFSLTSNQCITSSIALSRSLQTIPNVEDSQKPERVQAQVAGMDVLVYAVYFRSLRHFLTKEKQAPRQFSHY